MMICELCSVPMKCVMSFSKEKCEKFNKCPKCHSETKHQKLNKCELNFGEALSEKFIKKIKAGNINGSKLFINDTRTNRFDQ